MSRARRVAVWGDEGTGSSAGRACPTATGRVGQRLGQCGRAALLGRCGCRLDGRERRHGPRGFLRRRRPLLWGWGGRLRRCRGRRRGRSRTGEGDAGAGTEERCRRDGREGRRCRRGLLRGRRRREDGGIRVFCRRGSVRGLNHRGILFRGFGPRSPRRERHELGGALLRGGRLGFGRLRGRRAADAGPRRRTRPGRSGAPLGGGGADHRRVARRDRTGRLSGPADRRGIGWAARCCLARNRCRPDLRRRVSRVNGGARGRGRGRHRARVPHRGRRPGGGL